MPQPLPQAPQPAPRAHSIGNMQQNFEAGQYAHTAPNQSTFNDGFAAGCYSATMASIGTCLGFFGSIPCCFCFPNPYRTPRSCISNHSLII